MQTHKLLLVILLALSSAALAESPLNTTNSVNSGQMITETTKPSGFGPTWVLLSSAEKQQFIAGYLKGLSDGGNIADIAITYIKDNPKGAIEGLESLKKVWGVSGLTPQELTHGLDKFYSEASNRDKPLSIAISIQRDRF